jgi:hypothetical protein
MILSFSVFREKLESGEKKQTIRKFSPGQYARFVSCWSKRETTGRYNLFWHNPRNGGVRIKDVVPSDKPSLIYFERFNDLILCYPAGDSYADIVFPKGEDVNNLAARDGFVDHKEMYEWFFDSYGEKMFTGMFIVLRWS